MELSAAQLRSQRSAAGEEGGGGCSELSDEYHKSVSLVLGDNLYFAPPLNTPFDCTLFYSGFDAFSKLLIVHF